MKKIALPALLAGLLVTSCTKPKDLEYVDFRNVRLLQMGLVESTVGLDIRFYNPNRQTAQLKTAAVDVYVNDKFLGKTQLDSMIQIPNRDTFSIPIRLKVETLSAATNVLGTLGDTTALIRLEGNAQIGKAGIYKNFPIKFEGRRKITL